MASSKQNSKAILIIPIVIVIIIAAIFVVYNSKSTSTTTKGQVSGAFDNKTGGKSNNPKVEIDKKFNAAPIDMNGKQSKSQVEMTIKYAEKAEDILIKGTPATAKSGSKFLVLQVELNNNSNERLIVSPLDLVRLVVDDQKRAAEIYTEEFPRIKGSVVIEPDSTKVTRIGFVLTPEIVNKQFKLQIGEINEPNKELIDIKI